MPKFTRMNPKEVVLGRGRSALEARKPYEEALRAGDAGRIDLERGEKASTVKRHLSEAAKGMGVKVRSSWADKSQRTLLWKKSGRG